MLAYVFWHWPQAEIDRQSYRDHLGQFYETLAAHKPDGFRESVTFRISAANWLETKDEAYEEWYLLDDSAALDRLNDAAVSGACETPHNRVAREAADGKGGLYRLRLGRENLSEERFAYWLTKPRGVSYQQFFASLEPLTSQPGVALWGRQMTLGPTTEFCLHSVDPIQIPPGYLEQSIVLEPLWPGA